MKDKIKSAIFNEFGREPGKVEKAAEGLKHETYFVEVDGEEYVLQFLGEEREDHNALSHCLDCYRLLEDVVPVPSIVTPEPRKVEGHEYTVVEKLPGGNAELEITPEKVFNAGRTLARIHDYMEFEEAGWISFEDEVTVYPFEEGSLKRKIISDLEEKTEVYRKEGMKEVAAVVQKFIDSKIGGLPEKFVPVICHDDFSPDNILFQNGEVTGVIDFDYAYAGHDQKNLVKSANNFWMHDPEAEWDIHGKMYEGYREIRDTGEDFQQNEPLYRIETIAQLIAGMIKMGEFKEKEKDYYREKLPEIIEDVCRNRI